MRDKSVVHQHEIFHQNGTNIIVTAMHSNGVAANAQIRNTEKSSRMVGPFRNPLATRLYKAGTAIMAGIKGYAEYSAHLSNSPCTMNTILNLNEDIDTDDDMDASQTYVKTKYSP